MLTLWQQHRLFCSAPPCSHGCNSPITGGRREEGQYNCSRVAWFGFKMAAWPTMCGISTILRPPCQGIGSQGCRSHAGLKFTHSYLVTRSRVQQSGVIFEVFEPQAQSDTKKNGRRSVAASETCYSTCCLRETRLLLFTMKYKNKTQRSIITSK